MLPGAAQLENFQVLGALKPSERVPVCENSEVLGASKYEKCNKCFMDVSVVVAPQER